ncbi:MAG TPA: MGMT family protein [Thermoanaerobaculia bacterium]|nr:MGMT family protein [Thermoanaerobaculia bacterium]
MPDSRFRSPAPGARRPPGRAGSAESPRAPSSLYRAIYRVVARIPAGRVSTYGEVARLAGFAGAARQVGYALHALPTDAGIPWHRVINARGEVSARSEEGPEHLQRALLEEEGIEFDLRGRCDLSRWLWKPRARGRDSSR